MKFLLPLVLFFFVSAAQAQEAAPVTISAGKSLEWDRTGKAYTARQNVIVTHGAATLRSDLLVARYAGGKSETDIKTLEATGDVVIDSAPYTAYGDRAVYDVASGNAVLTGSALRITSGDDLLTARDRLEYDGKSNVMTARGAAKVVHGENTLFADTVSAWFEKDAKGKTAARKVTATGGVTIKTPKETATGDQGVYDLVTQQAVLTGKVRVLQGQNWLEGARADVDMNTGISRLSGGNGKAGDGRVTGVFYPKEKTK